MWMDVAKAMDELLEDGPIPSDPVWYGETTKISLSTLQRLTSQRTRLPQIPCPARYLPSQTIRMTMIAVMIKVLAHLMRRFRRFIFGAIELTRLQ
jgi:hypothetical protein